VAIIGIILSVTILALMPTMKWIAGLTLGVVLLHIALLLALSLSVLTVLPARIKEKFTDHFKKPGKSFDAGWGHGWMNGFWIVSALFLALAIHIYTSLPNLQVLAFVLFLFSLNFFIGNLIIRSREHTQVLTLPWVRLVKDDTGVILDAGCGAGRTTLALSKIFNRKIIAYDRFDSDYIAGGGNTLLEKNLKRAGIGSQVEIVKGDITVTGYPDNHIDAIVSSYMIDHLGSQKLAGLMEINRILKPGGRLLMIVLVPNLSSFAILNILSFFLTSKKAWRKLFSESNFRLVEEGEINGGGYFLIEKS
jgi:SAM-dependent methyltransferase